MGLSTATSAQTPASEGFLVRRTVHIDDEITGLRLNSEFAIFRDGQVVGSIRTPTRTQVFRGHGTLVEARKLQRTLSQGRLGSEVGRCFYRDQPGQGAEYRSVITWFGRTGEQSKSVTIGDPFARLCPDSLIRSVQAIQQFFFDAIGRPDAQFEDLPPDLFGTSTEAPVTGRQAAEE